MFPPILTILQASATVRSLLGNTPRVFKHGQAPQSGDRPYGTWQVIVGVPENSLGETPSIDNCTVQIDLFAATQALVEECAGAVRDAMETTSHMTAWRNPPREETTKLFRVSMDFDYWLPRTT